MNVLLCDNIELSSLESLLEKYSLTISMVENQEPIPGSFWQDPEAGLIRNTLYLRQDTPVHSALHEACHFICMDDERRQHLDTNAGGDFEEEDAVCFLQIILADYLPTMGKQRMFTDMDNWGYSFRLGSAENWFYKDADDALSWLIQNHILDATCRPTWNLRTGI